MQVMRRTCGYIGTNMWGKGRTPEIGRKSTTFIRTVYMNYAKIRKFDVSNGPGVRTTLFVSGCTNKCEGCFNNELQDFNYGEKWTKETEE